MYRVLFRFDDIFDDVSYAKTIPLRCLKIFLGWFLEVALPFIIRVIPTTILLDIYVVMYMYIVVHLLACLFYYRFNQE